MTKNLSTYYWFCQLAGWSFCGILFLLFPLIYNVKVTLNSVGGAGVVILAGILSTHLFRQIIRKKKWLGLPFKGNLIRLCVGVILTSILAGSIKVAGSNLLGSIILHKAFSMSPPLLFTNSVNLGLFIVSWTALYCLTFYIKETGNRDCNSNRLKLRLNERQRQSAGLSANINSITDSLKGIGELIDKNPSIARDKISEFSNFLRGGILEQGDQIKVQH